MISAEEARNMMPLSFDRKQKIKEKLFSLEKSIKTASQININFITMSICKDLRVDLCAILNKLGYRTKVLYEYYDPISIDFYEEVEIKW